ncbi:MAG TPA: right-handed parallel beta-helix repeat-containing protein [Planctomycetota bacterium]|nr:right-handed parallel beta-helix repeat-containing protein [Planctomycetota bacterium]
MRARSTGLIAAFIAVSMAVTRAGAEETGRSLVVAPDGDDRTGTGASDRPWRTLRHAATQLRAGDDLVVRAGDYVEGDPDDRDAGVRVACVGRADAWIRIRGEDGARPTITAAAWYALRIEDSAYVAVSGLAVRTRPFKAGSFAGDLGCGIGALRSQHVRFRGNDVRGCGGGGISAIHSDHVHIVDNVVVGNAFGNPFQCSGISLYQCRDLDPSDGYRNFIIGNVCAGNENRVPHHRTAKLTDGNGIIVDDGRNTQGRGPHVAYDGATLIADNLCAGNGGRGIHVFLSDNVDVVGNTCHGNGRTLPRAAELSVARSDAVRLDRNVAQAIPGGLAAMIERIGDAVAWRDNVLDGSIVAPQSLGAGGVVADPRFLRANDDPERADFSLDPRSPAHALGAGRGPEARASTPYPSATGTRMISR